MKEHYIVTGANGHLGNTIVKKLADMHKSVRCLVLPNDKLNSLQNVNCQIVYGDVTCKTSLQQLFDVPDDIEITVIHCAAIVSISSKYNKKVYEVNVNGTKNVADISLERNVKKFVHVSSVHAIPEGEKGSVIKEIDSFDKDGVVGLYAKTKAEASQYVLDKTKEGLNACIVHPSGIIGPNDYGNGHLTQMIMDYLNGRLTSCVKGGYDFVDVRDVADAVINAVTLGKKSECYVLSGHYMTVRNVLDILSDVSGKKKIKSVLPIWFVKTVAPLCELYYKLRKQSPLFTKYSLYTLCTNSNFENEKAKMQLGFNPRPLETTLKDTAEWLTQHGRIKPSRKKKIKQKAANKI